MPNEKQDANQGVIDAPKSKGSRVKLKGKKRSEREHSTESFAQNPIADEPKTDITKLKKKSMTALVETAESLGVESPADLKKPALIFSILQAQSDSNGQVFSEGVLEILPDGYGFLRSYNYNYFDIICVFILIDFFSFLCKQDLI